MYQTVKFEKRVLLLDFDLYRSIGGGQTVYCELIENNPAWQFYYFIDKESIDTLRPANAIPILYSECYSANTELLPERLAFIHEEYEHSWRLAGSVKNALGFVDFDIVDAPDYSRRAIFIRQSLAAHGIRVGSVALVLHGTITQPLNSRWPQQGKTAPRKLAELQFLEHLQFRVADLRYGLSDAYAAEWRSRIPLPIHVIDPLSITGSPEPVESPGATKPDLIFVGRRERRKGPDVFLDLAWCLDPELYDRIIFIGSADSDSDDLLNKMADLRGLRPLFMPAVSREELDVIFRRRAVLVASSKVDTFNLVALEALRLGCPTFVSAEAGLSHWLKRAYPGLSHLVVDLSCSRLAVAVLIDALSNYDAFRARIATELRSPSRMQSDFGLSSVYSGPLERDRKAQFFRNEMHAHLTAFFRPLDKFTGNAVLETPLGSENSFLPDSFHVAISTGENSGLAEEFRNQEDLICELRGRLVHDPERTSAEVRQKLEMIDQYAPNVRVARCSLFREMARLERKRGNDQVAAAYHLRIMRWAGYDHLGALDYVTDTLRQTGFSSVADVAEAMYGDTALAHEASLALLKQQYEKQLTKPALASAVLDDRRKTSDPRVAIIVSLYNAEDKLATLLGNISLQTLHKQGKLEVILVDSDSPSNEFRVFRDWCAHSDLDMLYCRSAERETIQGAWNRGIRLARAPYLCFLGADEGLHPRCLERLADQLDKTPTLDWITADSIVTDVDKAGRFDRDIMPYLREGLDKNLQQLETCYVNYVGGLYRKSIHDRFGYYDESFRGAGDTEFKARILPKITVAHYPEMLGVFNNYPEARTTASPMAEIEDLRAWYLHRTTAGMSYRFEHAEPGEVVSLLKQALRYRKSYCAHSSTDFDLAGACIEYLQSTSGLGGALDEAALNVLMMRRALRELDKLDFATQSRWRAQFIASTLNWMELQQDKAARLLQLPQTPDFQLTNDNRFEQHWWSWSGL